MTTIKCKNCGKNVKANEEVVNYSDASDQPAIVVEQTAKCSCGAQLRDWRQLTRQEIFDGLALLGAYDKAATTMPAARSAAQGRVWEVEGF